MFASAFFVFFLFYSDVASQNLSVFHAVDALPTTVVVAFDPFCANASSGNPISMCFSANDSCSAGIQIDPAGLQIRSGKNSVPFQCCSFEVELRKDQHESSSFLIQGLGWRTIGRAFNGIAFVNAPSECFLSVEGKKTQVEDANKGRRGFARTGKNITKKARVKKLSTPLPSVKITTKKPPKFFDP
uniref:Secreted protein n=1 Tax=Steinernema glaseri TaxID=37863 RepID=A0A1I7ZHQ6_9BILA